MEDFCVLLAFPSVAVSFGMLALLKAVASSIARERATPSNGPQQSCLDRTRDGSS